jgi:hypothetical protein
MRIATSRVAGLDTRESRAILQGTLAVLQSSFLYEADMDLARKLGGRITAEEARDANALLLRTPADLKSLDRGLATLQKLGMPFTQNQRVFDDFTTAIHKLVAVHTDDAGSLFLPKNGVDEVNANAGRIVKEMLPWHNKPATPLGATWWAAGKMMNIWRTVVVVGFIIPKFAHSFANTGVADISQVWWKEGVLQAGRVFYQTLPAQLPMYGRVFMKWQARMEKWAAGKPVLGSLTNALMNPVLSQVFVGASDDVVDLGGTRSTLREVRKMLVDDGIMATEVQA